MMPLRTPLKMVARLVRLYIHLWVLQACAAIMGTGETTKSIVDDLTRQADAWNAAIRDKDWAALDANMANDFRHIRANGDVSNRAAFLAFIMSPRLAVNPCQAEDVESHYRYVDVYARMKGRWKEEYPRR
ncbi:MULTISPECIES: nuclear transport factor 2 family protein [unclassified Janthinobacterium]|uniref:nuclear transport factor 2 family protein n=1 Tax=unclassified Janthinobacterium TaxID=2610881 RepID=UPI0012FCA78D|nr:MULTISPECIES: nuclear transport factor 2 family protein [unclassified Janthinobacterium]MEC5163128.1 hypothetical protein [Janthinobacterium sp. CG_S6]